MKCNILRKLYALIASLIILHFKQILHRMVISLLIDQYDTGILHVPPQSYNHVRRGVDPSR